MEVLCEVLLLDISFSLSNVPFLDFAVNNWCLFFPHLQVLHSMQPLIVYFPYSSQWLSRAVSKSNQKDFLNKVQEMFDKLLGRVVLMWTKQSWNWVKGQRKICKLLKFIKLFTPIHRHAHLKHLNSLSFRYHSRWSFSFLFFLICIFSLQISYSIDNATPKYWSSSKIGKACKTTETL